MLSRSLVYTSKPDVSYSSAAVIVAQPAICRLATVGSSEMIVWTGTETFVSAISRPQRAHTNGYYAPVQAEFLFNKLIEQWHEERGITSSITDMALCPSYQSIIAMGENALPLIFHQMEREGDDPDHWFWALEAITGEDPVPEEAYGDTMRMAGAWLSWARERNVW